MIPMSALFPLRPRPEYRRCETATHEAVLLTIGQAIERYGEAAIWPPQVLEAPRSWWCVVGVTTGDDGKALCDCALTPAFFAARTAWRVVRDTESGRSDLRYPCPDCGDLLAHVGDHDRRHRR